MHVAYYLYAPSLCFLCEMDPCVINMMPGASVATHISLLDASITTHAHDPFSEFHRITFRAHRFAMVLTDG